MKNNDFVNKLRVYKAEVDGDQVLEKYLVHLSKNTGDLKELIKDSMPGVPKKGFRKLPYKQVIHLWSNSVFKINIDEKTVVYFSLNVNDGSIRYNIVSQISTNKGLAYVSSTDLNGILEVRVVYSHLIERMKQRNILGDKRGNLVIKSIDAVLAVPQIVNIDDFSVLAFTKYGLVLGIICSGSESESNTIILLYNTIVSNDMINPFQIKLKEDFDSNKLKKPWISIHRDHNTPMFSKNQRIIEVKVNPSVIKRFGF